MKQGNKKDAHARGESASSTPLDDAYKAASQFAASAAAFAQSAEVARTIARANEFARLCLPSRVVLPDAATFSLMSSASKVADTIRASLDSPALKLAERLAVDYERLIAPVQQALRSWERRVAELAPDKRRVLLYLAERGWHLNLEMRVAADAHAPGDGGLRQSLGMEVPMNLGPVLHLMHSFLPRGELLLARACPSIWSGVLRFRPAECAEFWTGVDTRPRCTRSVANACRSARLRTITSRGLRHALSRPVR